jgi:NTE family protein
LLVRFGDYMKKRGLKIGLALGGGGVRSLAHLGVIRLLGKEKIPLSLIVGSSMGAVVGGAYALLPEIDLLQRKMLGFLQRKELFNLEKFLSNPEHKRHRTVKKIVNFVKELYLWNLKLREESLFDGKQIANLIQELVGDKKFDQTEIPFAAIATDLEKGEEIILNKGKMASALVASIALPGIFPPLELENRTLVDGGVISQIPVEAAFKLGAEAVIAVDVEEGLEKKDFPKGIDILFQTDKIRAYELNRMKLALADFVIRPGVQGINWAHFSRGGECAEEGEKAAREAMPKIKKMIRRRQIKKFFGFLPAPACRRRGGG